MRYLATIQGNKKRVSQTQHTRLHDAAFSVRNEPIRLPAVIVLARLSACQPARLLRLSIFDIGCICFVVRFQSRPPARACKKTRRAPRTAALSASPPILLEEHLSPAATSGLCTAQLYYGSVLVSCASQQSPEPEYGQQCFGLPTVRNKPCFVSIRNNS